MVHRTSLFSAKKHRPVLRTLRSALWAIGLAGANLMSTPVWADDATRTQMAQTYSIAPGPLGPALLSFAGRAGVNLSMDMSLTHGLMTEGLNGTYAVQDGFDRLLAGSGLRIRQLGAGAFTLDRALEETKAAGQKSAPVTALAPIMVTGRMQSDLMSPIQPVTILARDQLETLREGSDSVATLLSKVIPGMSDSSHTITDFGQTLRGRNMLVLVDGIPLNTNRNSSRNLANINAADIDQIEVLRGSSAIYGSGAAGGIVSIRTRQPNGETRAETMVSALTPLSRLGASGLGGEIQQYLSGGGKKIDYSLSLGLQHVGGSFDAQGHRIAPEPSQGDLFDSNIYSASGKAGLQIDADQRLQFSASRYDAEQDTDYASDPSVAKLPPGSVPAQAIKGLQLDEQNQVHNTLLNLDYRHRDIAGSALTTQAYYRDFYTRFAPFDARAISVRGGNVDQALQKSNVFGGRITIKTPLGVDENTQLTWGADFNDERSEMPLDVFDSTIYDTSRGLRFQRTGTLTYMPPITTRSLGGFAQLEHRFNKQWAVQAGARYDWASARFDEFVPLSQLHVADPRSVAGGTIQYGAWTYNAGVVFNPIDGYEFYASYSQGFELPDIGLQVRNATPEFNFDGSNLEPVKTDTVELGWRGTFANVDANLSVFHSKSDLGAVQSFNHGLSLLRTKERVYGIESGLDYFSDDEKWVAGGTFTWMKGVEQPQSSDSYRNLTGYRIPPLKLTAYLEYNPTQQWSYRVQGTHFASKDYRLNGETSFGRRQTNGYATVDVTSRWTINDKNKVTFGVQNLFNHYYYPLYSQLMRNSNNTSHLPAPGAVLTVSYTHEW
ncbi:MAG: TonB-dependent receptor [Nevskiaceae bacterium]|nr:MAG: TonB-dependent receptor [Nevskiaceae bacterium]TBR72528.1 MAG: TonB-dependent receptor [Nevskiaceae bacterium]